ncbi:MAG: MotA/TolQ/ExbB proton channel family protein [Elusimicrobia bacterium]|nr:MotA/TolQ/ExbB proton channel family protein [Elusimicrobiota bacterium]
MPEINLLEILRTSFTLIILLFCSVVTLTFTIERWWFYRSISINADGFLNNLRQMLEGNKFADAMKLCASTPGPIPALAQVAVSSRSKSKSEVAALLNAAQIDQRKKLENYLGILGTMGNTAPFIGLFGTVVGIIRAFHDLAMAGSGGPSVVAAGIAEALVATAGGLAVAIPAAMLYNYFLKKVKDISSDMESSSIKIMVYLGLA